MRLYAADSIETLQTIALLNRWAAQGLVTQQQQEHLRQETVSDLRTTNPFLRAVLFVFTLLIVALFTGLVLLILSEHSDRGIVVLCLLEAVACYAAAEFNVREYRLYHSGVEEALVVCSIGFLFAGLELATNQLRAASHPTEFFILLTCAVFSLWTWHRFGYWYTFVAALLFTAFLPGCWTASPAVKHTLVALLFAAGLFVVAKAASRKRFDSMRSHYSIAEMLLWAGIYLAINLMLLAAISFLPRWATGLLPAQAAFPKPFYWLTWLLTWCLSAMVLIRGIRRKDRFLLGLGACLTILTAMTNKPYLGWQRHPWDPMILGALLIGGAWYLQRRLAGSPGGVYQGFTAARLAGSDTAWTNAGSSALGFLGPHFAAPRPGSPDLPLGEGGASGGGGAGGNF